MKLLFDQNLSFRIVLKLHELFPEAKQVRSLGLENSTDREIWEYAKRNEFTIVNLMLIFTTCLTFMVTPLKSFGLEQEIEEHLTLQSFYKTEAE